MKTSDTMFYNGPVKDLTPTKPVALVQGEFDQN
jgi:hypothetical protein